MLIFATVSDKHMVLQNKQRIKDLVNSKDKKFYFRDFKTQKQVEMSKKLWQVQEEVATDHSRAHEDVYIKKNEICIGENDKYHKKVFPPDTTKLIREPLTNLNKIMATKVNEGVQFQEKGNVFTGYTVCTNSIDKIQEVYNNLRLTHADARHIVAAWNIPGVNRYECEDYCDDDEHGAGAKILQAMKIARLNAGQCLWCGSVVKNYKKAAFANISSASAKLFKNTAQMSSQSLMMCCEIFKVQLQHMRVLSKAHLWPIVELEGEDGTGGIKGNGAEEVEEAEEEAARKMKMVPQLKLNCISHWMFRTLNSWTKPSSTSD